MLYLIIGGSTGIGESLITQLNNAGHETISINRSGETNAGQALSANVIEGTLPDIDGPLDGLVYLPGSIVLKPFRALKDEDFLNDWNINFMGAVKVLRKYLPNLQQTGSASVVLISTVAVQTGMTFHSSIAAAKGAIEGFTRAMAAELAPKVRVNAIAPSLTLTPLSSKLTDTEQKLQGSKDRHPLKAVGQAEDVASMAAWLLSTNAQFTTGQIFKLDGGMSSIR